MSLGNILPMSGDKEDSASTPAFAGVKTRKTDETVGEVMHRYKHGELHAGPGGKHLAQSKEQALAIAMNVAEDSKKLDGGPGSGRHPEGGTKYAPDYMKIRQARARAENRRERLNRARLTDKPA
jgi:hypothetical protein